MVLRKKVQFYAAKLLSCPLYRAGNQTLTNKKKLNSKPNDKGIDR